MLNLFFGPQQQGGTLSLIECTLIEELDASDEDCEYLLYRSYLSPTTPGPSVQAGSPGLTVPPPNVCSCLPDNAAGQGFNHLEFKVVVEPPDGQAFSVVLLAPSRQEKAAWTSDISQVRSAFPTPGAGTVWGAGGATASTSLTSLRLLSCPPLSASTTSDATA